MIHLGDSVYRTKADLKNEFREFLQAAPDGQINDPVVAHKVIQLLLLHPKAEIKIGAGLEEVRVARNEHGTGKGFIVIRSDGSTTRFSYKKCIDGSIATTRFNAVEALRFIVRPQLIEFRQSIRFPVMCAITGRLIKNHQEMHIDHHPPFWKLVQDFCQELRIDLATLKTEGSGELTQLADYGLAARFADYHRSHAVLRPTLKSANLNKGGRLSNAPQDHRQR